MGGGFERITSTSTSSGEGGEDYEKSGGGGGGVVSMTTFLSKPEGLIPSNTSTASSSSSPAKKSAGRRSVKKRVVSVPIVEIDGSRPKGGGEGAPPSDSWTWRKYGQKPIKGSPYPRGYYRCSSSKGCPARKQVERSRVDPTMLIVTYAAEHNHAWPLPKNRNHHNYHSEPPLPPITTQLPAVQDTEEEVEVEEEVIGTLSQSPPTPAATTTTTTNTSTCSIDDTNTTPTFAPDLGEDDSPLMMMEEELGWRPYMSETSLQSDMAMMVPVSYDEVRKDLSIGDGGGDEDEDGSLFAGLGELPECSVVFRRGFSVGAV